MTRWLARSVMALTPLSCIPRTAPAENPIPPAAPAAPADVRLEATPVPVSVDGRLQLALLSSGLWVDTERLGALDAIDWIGLMARLRNRRASTPPGVDATIFELQVDTAAAGALIQDVYGLAILAGYQRAHWVTKTGEFTLCASGCARTNADDSPETKLRSLVIVNGQGVTLWSGREVTADRPLADVGIVKRVEAAWRTSQSELQASLTRACVESRACSHILIYVAPVQQVQLRRILELLDRVGRATSPSGAQPPALELGVHSPPAPGEEAAVWVVSGEPMSGWLPPLLIRQVVRSQYGVLRACYQQGLAKEPKLDGRVTVHFTIAENGTVADASNLGNDLPDATVVSCIIEAFKGIRFPSPIGGTVTVQYPIMLQPH